MASASTGAQAAAFGALTNPITALVGLPIDPHHGQFVIMDAVRSSCRPAAVGGRNSSAAAAATEILKLRHRFEMGGVDAVAMRAPARMHVIHDHPGWDGADKQNVRRPMGGHGLTLKQEVGVAARVERSRPEPAGLGLPHLGHEAVHGSHGMTVQWGGE